ncbi:MAG: hypothetical protein ACRCSU_10885 [Paracoccaceae bacterium]
MASFLGMGGQLHAEGFARPDLTELAFDRSALSAGEWIDRAEPARMTLICMGCDHAPVLDVVIGRQDDGTEGRVRSGETTIAMLEKNCIARDPVCRIEALDLSPAVGWLSSYRIGSQYAHTIVVLRDGDLLTIRSLADDAITARANADAAVMTIVPQVVGQ